MSSEAIKLSETQVFTPRWAADQMLDLLDQDIFNKDETFFFEPSCGDGAILIPILDRIFASLKKKHPSQEKALAETLHKFFAVELDQIMVARCRENVWNWACSQITESFDKRLLLDFMIANQIRDAIEHNNFFKIMGEAEGGEIARATKRKSVQKLRNFEANI